MATDVAENWICRYKLFSTRCADNTHTHRGNTHTHIPLWLPVLLKLGRSRRFLSQLATDLRKIPELSSNHKQAADWSREDPQGKEVERVTKRRAELSWGAKWARSQYACAIFQKLLKWRAPAKLRCNFCNFCNCLILINLNWRTIRGRQRERMRARERKRERLTKSNSELERWRVATTRLCLPSAHYGQRRQQCCSKL